MKKNISNPIKTPDQNRLGLSQHTCNFRNEIDLANGTAPARLLQPWSTPVLFSQLTGDVLDKMLLLTDEILESRIGKSHRKSLAGQIEQETKLDPGLLHEHGLKGYFSNMIETYAKAALSQKNPDSAASISDDSYLTEIRDMWIVSQKPGEYNPLHYHSGCHISAVMYLKVPEMVPSRKFDLGKDEDGAIIFTGPPSADFTFTKQTFTAKPRVGDIFLFAANQYHGVYPFRVKEEEINIERRSVSFNAIFQSRRDFDAGKAMSVLF